MKKSSFALLLFIGSLLGNNSLTLAQNKPNIVVFLVDDMGWMDTSLPFGGKCDGLK